MNRAHCNTCLELVPAKHKVQDGRVFLIKECPVCGSTESLISGDAARYDAKSQFDTGFQYRGCKMTCVSCQHGAPPSLVFIDVTNRCNLNCPICINNTPSMGFLFEPPFEYFEKIFDFLATFENKPAVQLFGGEPTARADLLEVIRSARAHGLPTRVVTNGIKLADPEYCRQLVASRATILIAYDGANPKVYAELRGSASILEKKVKAIDNIAAAGNGKVTLMTLIARGFNDGELPGLLEFCHQRRQVIRGIYLMPLTHSWDETRFALKPERTTMEDIEQMVDACFPDDRVDFLPAGFLAQIKSLMRALDVKPLPFLGAHPNCESMYPLISDGERYRPLSHYLKTTVSEFARDLIRVDGELAPHSPVSEEGGGPKGSLLRLRAMVKVVRLLKRHVRLGRVVKGEGWAKTWHTLGLVRGLLAGQRGREVLAKHSRVQGLLQLVILPFEDKETLETDRMERCPSAFAYYDPASDRVGFVPVCAWSMHKTQVMRGITDFYAARNMPEPLPDPAFEPGATS